MAISKKHWYECPAEYVQDDSLPIAPGQTVGGFYRPLVADSVDNNGGMWAISDQDSDTQPTSFIVVVNDRRNAGDARNPAVHAAIAKEVAAAVSLGGTLAAAKLAARARLGNARAQAMVDQIVGGE